MRLATLIFAAGVLAAPLAAQVPAGTTVGMQVTDTAGAPVGTVTAIQGANLQIKTDRHEAMLPGASFTLSDGKLLFGMTRDQLNAEIDKSVAAAAAAIAVGATVKASGGATVGVLEAIDAETATIKLTSGSSIRLPRSGIAGAGDGSVVVGLTAEQIEQQVQAAAAASSTGSSD